ncbi:hypothetical protein RRG08_048073 [Elysia crispata]|uniref:Uncharacterized protein n=1 Tax=Elysia crispata TaxID=231223 RepID=A0AAE0Z2L1_9GAST|nr:hypothetical protein RRG08_048073 [Elysia crispata]
MPHRKCPKRQKKISTPGRYGNSGPEPGLGAEQWCPTWLLTTTLRQHQVMIQTFVYTPAQLVGLQLCHHLRCTQPSPGITSPDDWWCGAQSFAREGNISSNTRTD